MASPVPIARFEVQTVLDQIAPLNSLSPIREFVVDGFPFAVKMNSPRYHLFNKNLSCVACGITGYYMLLETSRGEEHVSHKSGFRNAFFNLYSHDQFGNLVRLTQDHIVPASQGGQDVLENLQTMCSPCNSLKDNLPLTPEQVRRLRNEVYRIRRSRLNDAQMKTEIRLLIEDEIQKIVITRSRAKGLLDKIPLPAAEWGFIVDERRGAEVFVALSHNVGHHHARSRWHKLPAFLTEEEFQDFASRMIAREITLSHSGKEHAHAVL